MRNILSHDRSIDDGAAAIDFERIRRSFTADQRSPQARHSRNNRHRTPAADWVRAESYPRYVSVDHSLDQNGWGRKQ